MTVNLKNDKNEIELIRTYISNTQDIINSIESNKHYSEQLRYEFKVFWNKRLTLLLSILERLQNT